MRWTCPKCGKKLTISDQQLIDWQGQVLCPQCLSVDRQPIPQVAVNRKTTTTPPPYRAAQSSMTPPTRPPQVRNTYSNTSSYSSSRTTSTNRTAVSSRKKKKKGKSSSHISAWGCFLRSIAITLLLMAAYVFLGMLLATIT